MNSSGQTLIPAIPRRRKHRKSVVGVAFWLRGNGSSSVNFKEGVKKSEVSARKLAARLWTLRFMDVSLPRDGAAAFGYWSFPSSIFQVAYRYEETKDQLRTPITILRSRNPLRSELESSTPWLKSSKEQATECNPALIEEPNEFTMIHNRKHLEDRKFVGDSDFNVTILLQELLQAQMSINKAQKSLKKKVERYFQNLEEEKVFRKCRECQNIEAIIDDLKDKLVMERRSRKKRDVQNTKLTHELAKAKLSTKQFMTKYEKQKKEIELLREVCNELATQIREEKAKFDELQSDSMKICKEVEEERKMMQITEHWREERVQMKIDDARFVLEDKYYQMTQLIAFLQMFLRSKGSDTMGLEDVELIKQAVESINIQQIEELPYDFSKLDNI